MRAALLNPHTVYYILRAQFCRRMLAYKSDDYLPFPAYLCTLVYSEARVQNNESPIFESLNIGISISNTSSLIGGAPCTEARSNTHKKKGSELLNKNPLFFYSGFTVH